MEKILENKKWHIKHPEFYNNHQGFLPYQGYTKNENIMHASDACSFM